MIVNQLNMFIDKRIDGRIDEKVALAIEKMTAGFPTPVKTNSEAVQTNSEKS